MEDSQAELDPVAMVERVVMKAKEYLDRRKYVSLDSFMPRSPRLFGGNLESSLWKRYQVARIKVDAFVIRLQRGFSFSRRDLVKRNLTFALNRSSETLAALRNGVLSLKRSEERLLREARPVLLARFHRQTAVKAHDS